MGMAHLQVHLWKIAEEILKERKNKDRLQERESIQWRTPASEGKASKGRRRKEKERRKGRVLYRP